MTSSCKARVIGRELHCPNPRPQREKSISLDYNVFSGATGIRRVKTRLRCTTCSRPKCATREQALRGVKTSWRGSVGQRHLQVEELGEQDRLTARAAGG